MRRRHLGSVSVRSTDLDFSPQKNPNPYPAQLSVKGVCKGESPVPLCPVLLPFAGAKGRPPRRAVLTMPLQKAPPRRQAPTNLPQNIIINPQFCKFSIKKSEILTFHMQKRGDLQGLVKGLFLTGKKIPSRRFSPRPNKSRAFLPHRSNRGAG